MPAIRRSLIRDDKAVTGGWPRLGVAALMAGGWHVIVDLDSKVEGDSFYGLFLVTDSVF